MPHACDLQAYPVETGARSQVRSLGVGVTPAKIRWKLLRLDGREVRSLRGHDPEASRPAAVDVP